MPWKESTKVSERRIFIERLQGGERMSDLCREFGVSRKTGYKILARFERFGVDGLSDESRKPLRFYNQTPPELLTLILEIKGNHPTWGAAKIREHIRRKNLGLRLPSRSTIHEYLFRNNLVKPRRRVRRKVDIGPAIAESQSPNEVWSADFKGQFRLKNGPYCYPLTITDHFSRYLLACEALESTKRGQTYVVFDEVFKEFGLPLAIRTDNGSPFASRGLFGLSQLSIWWIKLGIRIQRSEPGHPEQNGRHERMHRTLKAEATKPPASTMLKQQDRFEEFKGIYNNQRPHQALEMKCPAEVYSESSRKYNGVVPEPEYPHHDHNTLVDSTGLVWIGRKKRFFLSELLSGERVGLREQEEGLWTISFTNYDLGHYDEKEGVFFPLEKPLHRGI